MIEELIKKNRSYRRFDENREIAGETLRTLVNLARLCPSASNLQPLKYILSNSPATNNKIFPALAWAGYLKNWHGPEEGERPAAYIVILGDTGISKTFGCDHGIAAQSILLGAAEMGLGGCMLGAVNRELLKQNLKIEDKFEILLAVALGKPKERVVIEELSSEGNIKYYRDERGIHHVPKRALDDIIISSD